MLCFTDTLLKTERKLKCDILAGAPYTNLAAVKSSVYSCQIGSICRYGSTVTNSLGGLSPTYVYMLGKQKQPSLDFIFLLSFQFVCSLPILKSGRRPKTGGLALKDILLKLKQFAVVDSSCTHIKVPANLLSSNKILHFQFFILMLYTIQAKIVI